VAVEASRSLLNREAPDASLVGIALAAVSMVVMPVLARAKRRANQTVGSQAMHADSKQTDLCAYLSVILLAGLLLNAVAGWWWADPAASLCMVPLIAWEGWGAIQGKADCGCQP
jgi:divalent metal cation (Fe/Co/Zn/Cd) transporter